MNHSPYLEQVKQIIEKKIALEPQVVKELEDHAYGFYY